MASYNSEVNKDTDTRITRRGTRYNNVEKPIMNYNEDNNTDTHKQVGEFSIAKVDKTHTRTIESPKSVTFSETEQVYVMSDLDSTDDTIELESISTPLQTHSNDNTNVVNITSPNRPMQINTVSEQTDLLAQIGAMFSGMKQEFNTINERFDKSEQKQNEMFNSMTNKIEQGQAELKQELLDKMNDFKISLRQEIESVQAEVNKDRENDKKEFELSVKECRNDLNKKIESKTNSLEVKLTKVKELCNTQVENNETVKAQISTIERNVETKLSELDNKLVEQEKMYNNEVMRLDLEVTTLDKNINHVHNELSNKVEKTNRLVQDITVKTNTCFNAQANNFEKIDSRLNKVELDMSKIKDNKEHHECNEYFSMAGNLELARKYELLLIEFKDTVDGCHPMFFLESAEKYVNSRKEPWEIHMLTILKYLKGNCERWARENVSSWNNFQQFKMAFKRKYWNEMTQRKFESFLAGKGNFQAGRDSLTNYVVNLYQKNKFLDRPYEIEIFLGYVAKHLPRELAATVATLKNVTDREELEKQLNYLERLLLTESQYQPYGQVNNFVYNRENRGRGNNNHNTNRVNVNNNQVRESGRYERGHYRNRYHQAPPTRGRVEVRRTYVQNRGHYNNYRNSRRRTDSDTDVEENNRPRRESENEQREI